MIVVVLPGAEVSLDDPNTFTAFSVRADGLDPVAVAQALGPESRAGEDDHVWISIARLHDLGRAFGDPDWRRGCDAMLAYAESQDWIDEEGLRVRAHIDR